MAWHISLSHRILRERWEDYWLPATGVRLDFLSNHWNMWLYKEGLCSLGLVLTQSLTLENSVGFSLRTGDLPCMEAFLAHIVLLIFGRGWSAWGMGWPGVLCWSSLELEFHQHFSPAWLQWSIPKAITSSLALLASLHMVPGAVIAVVSSASWFSHQWASCF